MSKSRALISIFIIACASLFVTAIILAAWTEPSTAPPGANVDTPINIGTTPQEKNASLAATAFIDTDDPGWYVDPAGGAGNISALFAEKVGIGTTNPDLYTKLHVSGDGNLSSGLGRFEVKCESSADCHGFTVINRSPGGGVRTSAYIGAHFGGIGKDFSGSFSGGDGLYADKICLGTFDNCRTDWPSGGGGGGVGGSGTNNYLAKWIAGTTLGNSIIYDNGTRVGIGTTNPESGYKLDINGNVVLSGAGSLLKIHDGTVRAVSPQSGYIAAVSGTKTLTGGDVRGHLGSQYGGVYGESQNVSYYAGYFKGGKGVKIEGDLEVTGTCTGCGGGGGDGNDYVDSVSFNTSNGILTLGRTGTLSDLTVDLDGRYLTSYTETDPQVGALNSGKWCTSDGSKVNCTSDAPGGGGGIGRYVGKTPSSYNGNLGGYTGAKAKCNSAFSGSHMCTGVEIVMSVQDGMSIPTGWYSGGVVDLCPSAGISTECEGWKTASSNYRGTRWNGKPDYAFCHWSFPILCCK